MSLRLGGYKRRRGKFLAHAGGRLANGLSAAITIATMATGSGAEDESFERYTHN